MYKLNDCIVDIAIISMQDDYYRLIGLSEAGGNYLKSPGLTNYFGGPGGVLSRDSMERLVRGAQLRGLDVKVARKTA